MEAEDGEFRKLNSTFKWKSIKIQIIILKREVDEQIVQIAVR